MTRPVLPQVHRSSFGPGEREAISLAHELGGYEVILDDLAARRLAGALGLPVTGTLGVLILAKRRGLVPAIRPLMDALVAVKFRLGPNLYRQLLARAGEDA